MTLGERLKRRGRGIFYVEDLRLDMANPQGLFQLRFRHLLSMFNRKRKLEGSNSNPLRVSKAHRALHLASRRPAWDFRFRFTLHF